VKLVVDKYVLFIITSTGDGLFNFINIDDFERLWTPKIKNFTWSFRDFGLQHTF